MSIIHGSRTARILELGTCLQSRSWKYFSAPSRAHDRIFRLDSRAYATSSPGKGSFLVRNALLFTTIALGSGIGYLYITDTRSSVHRWFAVPLIRAIWPDAEDAHHAGVSILKALHRFGIHPRERGRDTKDLEVNVFGHTLVNPLGISSGLDKNGEIPTALFALGPAVVEIGGVTETWQIGNPKPRVFRVVSQQGMINRYGLNSDGAELVAARLRHRVREFAYKHGYGLDEDAERFVLNGGAGVPPGSLVKGKLMAVQVAKNASTPEGDIEAIKQDYVRATSLLAPYADLIILNLSCPNVPGFQELYQAEPLTKILTGVVAAAASVDRRSKPAVMVKVNQDTDEQVANICAAVWASGVDGVVVGNTTTLKVDALPGTTLTTAEVATMREKGGYSGPQLFNRTVDLVAKYRRVLDYPLYEKGQSQLQLREFTTIESETAQENQLPKTGEQCSTSNSFTQPALLTPKVIFCTGGITNGQQALQVLNAGASVAQIYTGMLPFEFGFGLR